MFLDKGISIIVPVYNSENTIEKCLKRIISEIKKIKCREFEIVVVDDHSNDNTNKIIEKFKEVTLIKLKQNKGVGYARNIGAKISKNEILCYIDSDLIISENSILFLLKRLIQNDQVGSVGAIPILPNLNLNQWSSNFVALKTLFGFRDIKNEFSVSEVQSEFFLIYKDFLREIGGWKTLRNAGGEEYELGYRVISFGKKNLKIKDATYTTYWNNLFYRLKKIIDRTEKYLHIFLNKKKFETSESFASSNQALSALLTTIIIFIFALIFYIDNLLTVYLLIFFLFLQMILEYKFLVFAKKFYGLKMLFFSFFGIQIINIGILFGGFFFIFKFFKNIIDKLLR